MQQAIERVPHLRRSWKEIRTALTAPGSTVDVRGYTNDRPQIYVDWMARHTAGGIWIAIEAGVLGTARLPKSPTDTDCYILDVWADGISTQIHARSGNNKITLLSTDRGALKKLLPAAEKIFGQSWNLLEPRVEIGARTDTFNQAMFKFLEFCETHQIQYRSRA